MKSNPYNHLFAKQPSSFYQDLKAISIFSQIKKIEERIRKAEVLNLKSHYLTSPFNLFYIHHEKKKEKKLEKKLLNL